MCYILECYLNGISEKEKEFERINDYHYTFKYENEIALWELKKDLTTSEIHKLFKEFNEEFEIENFEIKGKDDKLIFKVEQEFYAYDFFKENGYIYEDFEQFERLYDLDFQDFLIKISE